MTRIIAIDPGPHTGIAYREVDGSIFSTMIHNDNVAIMSLILEFEPDEIAVERFATHGRVSGYGHRTIELVGICMGIAHAIGAKCIVRTPQQRYAFMDESRKHFAGKKGITQHEKDAVAHLLSWEYWRTRA